MARVFAVSGGQMCVEVRPMADNNGDTRTQEVQVSPAAPGRKILKVTSILLIVFGSIGFVFYSFLVGRYLFYFLLIDTFGGIISSLITWLYPVFQIFTGIIGIKNCNNIEKAKRLRAVGIAHFVVVFIFALQSVLIMGIASTLFAAAIILALPIIYLYGVQKNLKANKEKAE